MEKIRTNPKIIAIYWPGTFNSARPDLILTIVKKAKIYPQTFPYPPKIAVPPKTTVAIISSSQPVAIFGLTEPIRDTNKIAAKEYKKINY